MPLSERFLSAPAIASRLGASAFGLSVLDDADAPTSRDTLGVPGLIHGGFASAAYYGTPHAGTSQVTTTAMTANRLYVMQFPVARERLFDRIGLHIQTGVAATTIRAGLYTSVNGRPAALVFDAGTLDSSTAGSKLITIAQTLSAGMYWLACISNGAPTPLSNGGSVLSHHWIGPTAMNWNGLSGLYKDDATAHAALPNPFGVISNMSSTTPAIYLRAA